MNVVKQSFVVPIEDLDHYLQAGGTVYVYDGSKWTVASPGATSAAPIAMVMTSDPAAAGITSGSPSFRAADNPWPPPPPLAPGESFEQYVNRWKSPSVEA